MRDLPDGTLLVMVGNLLAGEVVPPSPTTEVAIVKLDRLTTSSASYGTVVTYTVPAATAFILSAVEIAADDYSTLQLRLTVGGVVKFEDEKIQCPFNPSFANVNLVAGAVVLLEAKSDGSTLIKVDGAIEGKEVS